MLPLVRDRVGTGDRDFENHTASHDSAGARRLRPDGDRLDHAHRDVVAGHVAGKTAHLNRVITGVGVLHIRQIQRGARGTVNQVTVTSPLVTQFRIRQRVARRDFQRHSAVQQSVRALGRRVDHRCL